MLDVAKKRDKPEGKPERKKGGRPATGRLGLVFQIKGQPVWRDAIREAARKLSMAPSELFDQATREYLKAHGVNDVIPPRR